MRFLNSTGGGVVRSFKGKDQVLVEDEDGFEVPVLIRECVVVGDSEMQVHSSRRSPLPSVTQAAVPQPKKPEPQPEVEKVTETIEGERLNIYLAYLPIEPAKVIQGNGYETYFINDSNYYLFFNYMNRQNNSWISRYNGIVEPNTQIFLEEFGKEELNDLERICVQLIAFKKDKPYSLKNAISVELHLDTVKFYKQHCFMENDFSMKMQWYTQSYARTSPKRITDLCCRTPASHAAEGARRPPCPPNDRQEESNRQLNSGSGPAYHRTAGQHQRAE